MGVLKWYKLNELKGKVKAKSIKGMKILNEKDYRYNRNKPELKTAYEIMKEESLK